MLNYKQLHYFWNVAKAGGVTRAAERLHLTPQTLSGQIALLEDSLGEALFRRVGRRLELTEAGRLALSYAEDIFRTGGELEEVLRGSRGGRPLQFRVGIADVVPKSVAYRLLAPAMTLPDSIRIVCREDKLDRLLGELAIHRLDLVLADSPMPDQAEVKGYSHKLGECGVAFLASPALAATLQGDFPACLDNAPLLVPGEGTAMRGHLMRRPSSQRI
ncbi:MAG: LysR family transcriptional regulator, partial [Thiobacillus sp.]|nr:LysR family transcriptional regulator [Thiobacillus sp.]